jgi:hypothetical protein
MKAALALLILYVGTFFMAMGDGQQGAAAGAEELGAAGQAARSAAVDPAKEADIRALLELAGFTEILKSAGERTSGEYTKKIRATVKDRARAQELSAAFRERFREHFSAAEMSGKLVREYDRNFTAEEIQELLKFYSSPLGQKFGAEMPKMAEGMQRAVSARSESAARETWQALRAGNAELGGSRARP